MKVIKLNEKYAVGVGVGYTFGEWKEVEKLNEKTKKLETSIVFSNTNYPSSWEGIFSELLDRIVRDKMRDVISLKDYVQLVIECKNEVKLLGKSIDKILKEFDKEDS
jgi:hypothetical protein